ncbi:hypothetical protein F5Y00DRAFT_269244 [Daldinia vernicosa]|uniref:uncharacterized protein n=1 Tax=Daldinia vernicosa TaxID=114800 RepID=UPI00200893C3|nr:uncharacterized protein F5Y00DRAFT_269244 [Daldinia vernicosa]KAI0853885.1 hypothetical protein F5Y00DRAFT_269244 [Daldinia vernicosa]
MDPNALSPELREKIQWAGNGVLTYRDAYNKMENPPQPQHGYGAPPVDYNPYGNGAWAAGPSNAYEQSQYAPSTAYYPQSSAYQETVYEAESEVGSEQDTVRGTNTNGSRTLVGGSQSRAGSRQSSRAPSSSRPRGPPSQSSWRPPFASQFGSDQGSVASPSRTETITLPLTRANLSALSNASQRMYPTPSQLYNMSPAHSPSPVPRGDTRQYRDQASSLGPRRQSRRQSTTDSESGGAPLWPSGSRRRGA